MASSAGERSPKRIKTAGDGEQADVVCSTTAAADKPTEIERTKKDSKPMIWLTQTYPNSPCVSLKFASDEQTYTLPQRLLEHHFSYFKGALKKDADGSRSVYEEGQAQHIHLQEIGTREFARLLNFVHNAACRIKPYDDVGQDSDNLDDILQALIAADYLGVNLFRTFQNVLSRRIASLLALDRTKLTLAHVELVTTHPAFKCRTALTWMAKARVRPFLQQSMLHTTGNAIGPHYPGSGTREEWIRTILHYCELRSAHQGYAFQVMEEVSRTLIDGRLRHNNRPRRGGPEPAPQYWDPLFEKETPTDANSCHDFTL